MLFASINHQSVCAFLFLLWLHAWNIVGRADEHMCLQELVDSVRRDRCSHFRLFSDNPIGSAMWVSCQLSGKVPVQRSVKSKFVRQLFALVVCVVLVMSDKNICVWKVQALTESLLPYVALHIITASVFCVFICE